MELAFAGRLVRLTCNLTLWEIPMEEAHHTHNEPAWGWAAVLNDWRRSRTRQRLRAAPRRPTAPDR